MPSMGVKAWRWAETFPQAWLLNETYTELTGPAPTHGPSGLVLSMRYTITRNTPEILRLLSDRAELRATPHALEGHNIEFASAAKTDIKTDNISVKDGYQIWKNFLIGENADLCSEPALAFENKMESMSELPPKISAAFG